MNVTCQGNLSVCHRFASRDVAYSVRTGGSFPMVKVTGAWNRPLDLYLAPSYEAVLPLCHISWHAQGHLLFQAALLLNNASCGSKFVNNYSTNTIPFSYNIYVSYPSSGFCTQAWLNGIREIDFYTIKWKGQRKLLWQVLSWYLPGRTEDNHKIPQPLCQANSWPNQDSNRAFPKYQVRSITQSNVLHLSAIY